MKNYIYIGCWMWLGEFFHYFSSILITCTQIFHFSIFHTFLLLLEIWVQLNKLLKIGMLKFRYIKKYNDYII